MFTDRVRNKKGWRLFPLTDYALLSEVAKFTIGDIKWKKE